MAFSHGILLGNSTLPSKEALSPAATIPSRLPCPSHVVIRLSLPPKTKRGVIRVFGSLEHGDGGSSKASHSNGSKKAAVAPNSNYMVPFDQPYSCITRPLAEILRDLNKKIPDNVIQPAEPTAIPWYHANRMLSFHAPGWCGEVRDIIYSDAGNVTVVYRVTVRGSDGEAHRESTGTVSTTDGRYADPMCAAEEIAFCRACARFGLGLYLYDQK